ncbi:MAG: MotA/TolQ/ExbB proton channel family protein [Planctomycetes bacterium]|nr:MotA/TolQ/ExbB proton channel family protein [Planctomycetota bacterium]
MRSRTLALLSALFLVTLVCVAGTAFAADAADSNRMNSGSITMKQILDDGGTVGWIIIVLSVATLAVIIECGVSIRRDKLCRPELIDEVEALLEEDEVQEALELCESEPNFFTNMAAAGLARANLGYDEMKTAAENRGGVEVTKLQQKVGWILWLSNIGPLLGLFGTVTGMIAAFNVIKALGAAVTPTDLATGISAALITTFDGLIVSMPAVTAYQYFRDKVTKIAIDFGGMVEDMFQRFRK